MIIFGFNHNKTPFYGTSKKRYEEMIKENNNDKQTRIREIGINQWKVFKQMVKQYMNLEPGINQDIDYAQMISQGQKLFEGTINQCKDLEKEINECKTIFECRIKQRKMFEQMINQYLEWK